MTTFKDMSIEKFQFEVSIPTAQGVRKQFNFETSYNTSCNKSLIWINFPTNCNYAIVGVQNSHVGYSKDVTLNEAKELLNNLK